MAASVRQAEKKTKLEHAQAIDAAAVARPIVPDIALTLLPLRTMDNGGFVLYSYFTFNGGTSAGSVWLDKKCGTFGQKEWDEVGRATEEYQRHYAHMHNLSVLKDRLGILIKWFEPPTGFRYVIDRTDLPARAVEKLVQ
jgi:hypothetical protein